MHHQQQQAPQAYGGGYAGGYGGEKSAAMVANFSLPSLIFVSRSHACLALHPEAGSSVYASVCTVASAVPGTRIGRVWSEQR